MDATTPTTTAGAGEPMHYTAEELRGLATATTAYAAMHTALDKAELLPAPAAVLPDIAGPGDGRCGTIQAVGGTTTYADGLGNHYTADELQGIANALVAYEALSGALGAADLATNHVTIAKAGAPPHGTLGYTEGGYIAYTPAPPQ